MYCFMSLLLISSAKKFSILKQTLCKSEQKLGTKIPIKKKKQTSIFLPTLYC